MTFIRVNLPDGTQKVQVALIKKDADGLYSVASDDGMFSMSGIPPDALRLEDENGNPIEPVVTLTQEEKLKNRLQAAEDAVVFLMDILMGGML